MTSDTQHGAPHFEAMAESIEPTSQASMDRALQTLQSQKESWVQLPIPERIALLDEVIRDFAETAPLWVAEGTQAKGVDEDSVFASEEWSVAGWVLIRQLQQLRQVLQETLKYGQPRIPGPVTTRPDGQVVAQVFPYTGYDRIFLTGIRAEIWMQPGVTAKELPATQALAYKKKQQPGRVVLVLGAGNAASIGPLDIISKLFIENQVIIYKPNPVNAYLGPLLEESFKALIKAGYLRVAYGGVEEGSYLCNHPSVDTIHITGSDKTFDAIVFGSGLAGVERKRARQPLVTKQITGELGNVSPVIVVPGPWSAKDLVYQAEHIAGMLANNAGFNCNATRVIIQHQSWPQREALMEQIYQTFQQLPARTAYYPGSHHRHQLFMQEHPEARLFGNPKEGELPWTIIPDVDANKQDDICFTTEAFCSLFAETALAAHTVVDYLEQAVTFANEGLWGTLNATILVHPSSLKDPAIAQAVDRAIARLRYGTIGVNCWAAVGFALGTTTWGAFPGHDIYDIKSGNDVVHNSLMFSKPQKSVVHAPFRSLITPPWFISQHKLAEKLLPRVVSFEANPSLKQLAELSWSLLKR